MQSIGKLSAAAGVKVPTIRFYEDIGLLPVAMRSASDRRLYDQKTVERLQFIAHARQLGFSIDAIRTLLDLSDHPDRPCGDANALASAQLASVDAKIERLLILRAELARLAAEACEGRVGDCRVIEALSSPPLDHFASFPRHQRRAVRPTESDDDSGSGSSAP